MSATPRPWTVDAAPDANGYFTIREADGSEHGNTDVEPIATVYEEKRAALIVRAVNTFDEACATIKELLTLIDWMGPQPGYRMSDHEEYARAQAVLAKLETINDPN